MNQLVPFTDRAPALVAAAGARASYRFFEFFTANIRNPHTRRAYARAAVEFFDWLAALCEIRGDRFSHFKSRIFARQLREIPTRDANSCFGHAVAASHAGIGVSSSRSATGPGSATLQHERAEELSCIL
jgi:hypothetical protein